MSASAIQWLKPRPNSTKKQTKTKKKQQKQQIRRLAVGNHARDDYKLLTANRAGLQTLLATVAVRVIVCPPIVSSLSMNSHVITPVLTNEKTQTMGTDTLGDAK